MNARSCPSFRRMPESIVLLILPGKLDGQETKADGQPSAAAERFQLVPG